MASIWIRLLRRRHRPLDLLHKPEEEWEQLIVLQGGGRDREVCARTRQERFRLPQRGGDGVDALLRHLGEL